MEVLGNDIRLLEMRPDPLLEPRKRRGRVDAVELGVELGRAARNVEDEPRPPTQQREQIRFLQALHDETRSPVADDRLVHARCWRARLDGGRQRGGLEANAFLGPWHAGPHEPEHAPIGQQEQLGLTALGDLLQRLAHARRASAAMRSTTAQAPTPAAAATIGVGGIV